MKSKTSQFQPPFYPIKDTVHTKMTSWNFDATCVRYHPKTANKLLKMLSRQKNSQPTSFSALQLMQEQIVLSDIASQRQRLYILGRCWPLTGVETPSRTERLQYVPSFHSSLLMPCRQKTPSPSLLLPRKPPNYTSRRAKRQSVLASLWASSIRLIPPPGRPLYLSRVMA